MTRSATKVLTAVVLALAAPAGFGAVASAAPPAWVPVPAAQVAAAVTAAHSDRAISFARTNFRRPGQPDPGVITVADTGVPAYTLDPVFVRGDGDGRVAVLEYVAVVARAQDGRTATIQAAPDAQAGWQVGSVLSGDDETRLATRLPAGAVLLDEPQINGWYALSADGVRLLQASLPQTPVGVFVPLANYQRQVHGRYADKQPGSRYQRDGGLGFAQHPEPAAAGTSGRWWFGLAVLLVIVFVVWFARRKSPVRREEFKLTAGNP
ncbi:MAG: hypothetical protein QOI78_520 [Actinomycetota bacterium]|jgi:hypothetical protein|nr:hypothetical protein [Actinomycetota bacterium]